MSEVVERICATAATAVKGSQKIGELAREHPDRQYGMIEHRAWHGAPVRTVNPWLVIERYIEH